MAKDKSKAPKGVPNKHLHARVAFLHQAASYLAAQNTLAAGNQDNTLAASNQDRLHLRQADHCDTRHPAHAPETADGIQDRSGGTTEESPVHEISMTCEAGPFPGGLPLHLSSQFRQVASKSQIRLHPSIKRSSCKKCDSILIEGQNCRKYIENLSKDCKKPHADVLVVQCLPCGATKRYPVGAKRQNRTRNNAMSTIQNDDSTAAQDPSAIPQSSCRPNMGASETET